MVSQTQTDLDVAAWLSTNPMETEPGSYPKIMYNVNLPPVLVRDAEAEASIGEAWRPLNIPLPDVPPVTLDPTSATHPAAGGTGSFTVTIIGPGASETWTADKDASADWLTIDAPTEPQAADGPVNYTVDANVDVDRTANIYVNGKTFTVTQEGLGIA